MAGRLNDTVGRWLRRILGVLFLIAGVVGLFLPVLQGVLFLLIGTLLLAGDSIWVRRKIASLRKHHPKTYATFRKWQRKARKKSGKKRRS